MKETGRKVIYYVLLCFCAAVFLVSGLYIAGYFVESSRRSGEYNDLANMLESLRATAPGETTLPTDPPATQTPTDTQTTQPPSEPTQPAETTLPTEPEPTEPVILPEYEPFYQMNSDMVGWICIPGTKINYPVMQTPDTPDYYLNRNFSKENSAWGTIYAREVCDVNAPSDNITIYGHYKRDGSMFTDLNKYKQKSFWQTHRTFSFDTLYEKHTYEIVAAFKTSANMGQGFSYHLFVNAENEGEFNEFVSTVKSMSFYDTGVTAVYGDKLLCLSTCEYSLNNGRCVVVAKRIS